MNKIIVTCFALAALLIPFAGQAESLTASKADITCPHEISGVRLERFHQYQVPNGWADDATGAAGYSGAVLYIDRNWVSNDGKKLYCAYGMRSSNSVYDLVVIVRNAPSRGTCSRGDNYTFRCTQPRMTSPMR